MPKKPLDRPAGDGYYVSNIKDLEFVDESVRFYDPEAVRFFRDCITSKMKGATITSLSTGFVNEVTTLHKLQPSLKKSYEDALKKKKLAYKNIPNIPGTLENNQIIHVALSTYSSGNGFYWNFNKICRELTDQNKAKFPFPYSLLTLQLGMKLEIPGFVKPIDLYRGLTLTEADLKNPYLQKDKKFLFKQFTSTTTTEKVAQQSFMKAEPGKLPVKIIVKNYYKDVKSDGYATYMNHHSVFVDENSEDEVLISPFVEFRVIKEYDRKSQEIFVEPVYFHEDGLEKFLQVN